MNVYVLLYCPDDYEGDEEIVAIYKDKEMADQAQDKANNSNTYGGNYYVAEHLVQ